MCKIVPGASTNTHFYENNTFATILLSQSFPPLKKFQRTNQKSKFSFGSHQLLSVKPFIVFDSLISPSDVLLQGPKAEHFNEQFCSLLVLITILGCQVLLIINPNNISHAHTKYQLLIISRY